MITKTAPKDAKRIAAATGGFEEQLTEPAVMLMLAFHLHKLSPKGGSILICPDGTHAQQLDIRRELYSNGFEMIEPRGTTKYGGVYRKDTKEIIVNPKSGIGDVSGTIGGQTYFAECKGAVINSTYAGHVSRQRSKLFEMIGQLVTTQRVSGTRYLAVCPATPTTIELAKKISSSCTRAEIELWLVGRNGEVGPPEDFG